MQKTVHIIGAGISGLSPPSGWPTPITGFTSTRRRRRPAAAAVYFDAATNLMIDNGNHLLLSGNRHALAYARSIGTEAGLVGPKRAQFPFVDLSSGQRWQLDLGDGRLPLWVFDETRRVPDTGLLDYLALMPLIWQGRTTGRQGDPTRHAVPAAGTAAAAGRAQRRPAGGLGGPCRRDRAGNPAAAARPAAP